MIGHAVIKDQKWITSPLHPLSPRPLCATGWCTADNKPLAAKLGTQYCEARFQNKTKNGQKQNKTSAKCKSVIFMRQKNARSVLFKRLNILYSVVQSGDWSQMECSRWNRASSAAAGGQGRHLNWVHWAGSAYSDHDKRNNNWTWRFLWHHVWVVIRAEASSYWGRWFNSQAILCAVCLLCLFRGGSSTGILASSQCKDVRVVCLTGGWIVRSCRAGWLDPSSPGCCVPATPSAGEAAIEKGWKIHWSTSLPRKYTSALKWSQCTICDISWLILVSCTWPHVKVYSDGQ